MTTKKTVVDTDHKRGQLFEVQESGGRFYAYHAGDILRFKRKIGEAGSLEDAIQLIKADVGYPVRSIRID